MRPKLAKQIEDLRKAGKFDEANARLALRQKRLGRVRDFFVQAAKGVGAVVVGGLTKKLETKLNQ